VSEVSKNCVVSMFMVLQYLPAVSCNIQYPFSSKQTRLQARRLCSSSGSPTRKFILLLILTVFSYRKGNKTGSLATETPSGFSYEAKK
jgi:hypothetical protein